MEENTSKAFVSRSEAPAAVRASGGASALFVINLCASQAPSSNVGKSLPGLDGYRLYQVSRVEDGRTRYRLRLGFFTSEGDADTVLAKVRVQYPTAFATCLCEEDRKFTRGYLPDSAIAPPVVQTKAPATAPPAAAATPSRAPAPAAAPTKPAAPAASAAPVAKAPAPAAKAPAPAAKAPAPTASTDVAAKKSAATGATGKFQKPTVAVAPPPAPADDDVFELTWEPERPAAAPPVAASPAPVAASAPPASTAAKATSAVPEFHWEPPALEPKAPAAAQPAPAVVAPVFKTQPVLKAEAPAKAVEAKPEAKAAPKKEPAPPKADAKPRETKIEKPKATAVELTLEKEPAPVAAASAPKPPAADKPFHVGKGVDIPAVALSLESTQSLKATPPATAAKPAAAPAKPQIAAKAPPAAPAVVAPLKPLTGKAKAFDIPDLDSTQTIRALTSAELNDESQEKWFAIQLAMSDQPVNLDAMPRLDIFEAYRLYSVANAGSGKIVHSLRLGFFREEVSADAVAGYSKTFFGTPSVVRISIAEHSRFRDPPTQKPKGAAAARNESKVVDLTHARDRAKPVVPTVTMEVAPGPSTEATGSFKVDTGSFDMNATGSFKTDATGSFKPNATGAFKTSATGTHKMSASGKHKALGSKPAAKSSGAATKRSGPPTQSKANKDRLSATGKVRKMTLQEELLDEARQVVLSESGIRKLPKNDSLLSRLVDKLTK